MPALAPRAARPGGRRLRAAVTAAVLACLLVLVAAAVAGALSDGGADLRVNVSGRQRMLTERYALETALAAQASGEARQRHLGAAATAGDVLLASERALDSGGPVPALDGTGTVGTVPGDGTDPRRDRGMLPLLEDYVAAGSDPDVGAEQLAATRTDVVTALDDATASEERSAERARHRTWWALVGTLLVVCAGAVAETRRRSRLAVREAAEAADATSRALVGDAPDGVVVVDADGAVRYSSPAAHRLGLPPGADGLHRWLQPSSTHRLLTRIARATDAGDRTDDGGSVSTDLETRDGRGVRADVRLDHPRDAHPLGTVVHLRDASAARSAELAMVRRHAVAQVLQESAAAANSSTTLDGALRLVLDTVCRHFGWRIGHAYVVAAADGHLRSSRLWATGPGVELEHHVDVFRAHSEEVTFASGVGLPGRVMSTAVPHWVPDVTADPNFPRGPWARAAGLAAAAAFPLLVGDEVVAVLEFFDSEVLAEDAEVLEVMGHVGTQLGRVVERERAAERLDRLARTDELTGLLNRRAFAVELRRRLHEAPALASVAYLDLDGFKDVNDALGHAAGDQVLVAVAQRLSAAVREGDCVARLGGDEFALVLTGPPDDVADRAAVLLTRVEQPVHVGGRTVPVRASIGVTSVHRAGRDGDALPPAVLASGGLEAELLVEADIALYAAKADQASRVVRYDVDLGRQVRGRSALDAALREAVSGERFTIVYQPIVDTGTGRVVSAEALLRWPEGEFGPAVFVPRLEAVGLIVPVGRWVLRSACREAARWQREGQDTTVSVNVSPWQLADPAFADDVRSALADAALHPHRLVLEVTESATMDPVAVDVLHDVAALGVGVAIDDFGTGWSSLRRLTDLPTTVLKLDKSLVDDVGSTERADHVVRACVQIAGALGLVTVAEGVETEVQRDALLAMGCSRIQGYLVGRPGPSEGLRSPAARPGARASLPRAPDRREREVIA